MRSALSSGRVDDDGCAREGSAKIRKLGPAGPVLLQLARRRARRSMCAGAARLDSRDMNVFALIQIDDERDRRSADMREEGPREAQARTPPASAAADLLRLPEGHQRAGAVASSSTDTLPIIVLSFSNPRHRLRKQFAPERSERGARHPRPPTAGFTLPHPFALETANPARAPYRGKTRPRARFTGVPRAGRVRDSTLCLQALSQVCSCYSEETLFEWRFPILQPLPHRAADMQRDRTTKPTCSTPSRHALEVVKFGALRKNHVGPPAPPEESACGGGERKPS